MTTDTKSLAYAVAEWLEGSAGAGAADATKLKQASALVGEAFGVNPSNAADKEQYAKGSPGLQAIIDVFLKTQKRVGGATAGAAAGAGGGGAAAAAAAAPPPQPSGEDAAKADALKNDGNKFMSSKDYGAALDAYTCLLYTSDAADE